ncbi:hypothetical protein WR25_05432 [Diploscapter pachys]|uniref:Uncharacterized protein n=1 Tax=Diploscapter pachys TaxID=2018661 RepID=A0A2A2KK97_9BILA|nr:hypothetical protein WR25_05432 [Diploscapter pachys]
MPSAARADMQPRKRLRPFSSVPFSARDRMSPSTLRISVPRFLSSMSSKLSKMNIASSIALATSLSILNSLGITRCSVALRAPCRISAASRVPPSVSPPDVVPPPLRRLASTVFSVSIASALIGPSRAMRCRMSGCTPSGSSSSTLPPTAGCRWAIITAAICGCSFSIICAISGASSQLSISSSLDVSAGPMRARMLSAFSSPSARVISACTLARGSKVMPLRSRALPVKSSSTICISSSETSATLSIAVPSSRTSSGSSFWSMAAASSSSTSIISTAARSTPLKVRGAGASLTALQPSSCRAAPARRGPDCRG